MRTNELIKLLSQYGVICERHGGNHDWYYSPITDQHFPVGRHAKEIPSGTVSSILKKAGIKL